MNDYLRPTMSMVELEERLKKHDHYYDVADDIKVWRLGNADRAELLAELRRWPLYIVTRLLKRCVPSDMLVVWISQLGKTPPPGAAEGG
jgi:hypothetical protein